MPPSPNILYLHSHDTGRYIQPYGYPVPTPNLQRLAEEGVLFRQAFSGASTCSPSRAVLLTGMCAHSNGMNGLAHRGWRLKDYSHHLIHTLHRAGYTSALFGIQHVIADEHVHELGYHRVLPDVGPAERVNAALDFFHNPPEAPFFLSLSFFETHRPFPEPDPSISAENVATIRPPSPLPDAPETRRDFAAYVASARRLDGYYGQILRGLAESGLAENTLVLCTTDHGIAFPGMKGTLTDHGLGVTLIMRGPAPFRGGRVIDAMVSHMDIFPTLCDWLGIDPPARLQGRSMMPLLRGEAAQVRDELFAEITYHAAYEPQRCVRTQRYKYIRRFDGRTRPVLANCDDGPSKDLLLRHGWADQPRPQDYLYDLLFDPMERENRMLDPSVADASADVLADMRERLQRWMAETDDPLLAGPVPAPPDAAINDPDAVSPEEPTMLASDLGLAKSFGSTK